MTLYMLRCQIVPTSTSLAITAPGWHTHPAATVEPLKHVWELFYSGVDEWVRIVKAIILGEHWEQPSFGYHHTIYNARSLLSGMGPCHWFGLPSNALEWSHMCLQPAPSTTAQRAPDRQRSGAAHHHHAHHPASLFLLIPFVNREPAQPCSRRLVRNISSNSTYENNHTHFSKDDEDDTKMQAEDDRLPCPLAACNEPWGPASSCCDGSLALHGGCTTATTSTSTLSVPHSPSRTSFDSTRPLLACLDTPVMLPVRQQQQPVCLLLGTSAGLYQLNLDPHACRMQQLALASVPVAHVCYSSCGLLLAACPVPEEAHCGDLQAAAAAKEAAGLYCLNLKQQQSSCSGSGFAGSSSVPAMKLWHGGAT